MKKNIAKTIDDNTVVRVRVPKALYEAIQKKIALREAEEVEEGKVKDAETEEDKPKYAGMNMSKTNVLNKVGKGKQSRKITGAKAAAYQPVHSRIYKEGDQVEEGAQDIISWMSQPENMETLGMIATALGITGGAAALAKKIKQSGGQPGGSTGAYVPVDEGVQDIVSWMSQPENMETLGMIATALGITGGAAALANKIKKSGGQPGGSTGVYIPTSEK